MTWLHEYLMMYYPSQRENHLTYQPRKAVPSMKITEIDVTPELAKRWLDPTINKANRTLSRWRVHHLEQILLRGEWKKSGEPIQFAGYLTGQNGDSPILLNGQHRLAAIAQAGISAPVVVVEGVDADAQVVMDTGKARSFADVLTMRGEHQVSSLAAAVRLAYDYENDLIKPTGGSRRSATHSQLLQYLDTHLEIHDALALARKVEAHVYINRSAMAVFIQTVMKIDEQDAAAFIEGLISGANLHEDDPILVLRRWLYNAQQSRVRPRPAMHLAILFKVWNAARTGRHIKHLAWRTFGVQAEAFPEPV